MLGMVFPTLYVSPNKAVPRSATSNKFRIKPVMRETIVPAAINEEALANELLLIFTSSKSAHTLNNRCN